MKLGTRMLAGSSRIIPGHFTPANLSITGADSMTLSDSAAISGSGTAKIVTDSMVMTDATTAKTLNLADAMTLDDTANATTPTVIVPATTSLPGVTPPKLPHVSHVFSSPGGTDTPDLGTDWWCEEAAPGGYGPGWGLGEQSLVDNPVYTPGANWQMWTEDGFLLWEGELSNVIPHSGNTELIGRGWKDKAEKDAGRLLFMTHPEMTPGDSDPVNINISDGFEMDTAAGRVAFTARKGEDMTAGEKVGCFFWAEGAELTSLAYELSWNGQGQGGQSIYIRTGIGPSPTYAELNEELNPSFSLTSLDARIHATAGGDLLWFELRRDTATPANGISATVKITLSDIRVRSIATSDDYSFADVAREVCSRLGVSDYGIHDTGDVMGALDWTDGSFAELLDYGATLSGTTWGFWSYGQGPVCWVKSWDDERFYTSRADGETDLVPVAQYNAVVVAYPTHNGRHRTITVTASDIGVADPYATTGYTNALHVEIDQKQADSDLAQSIGVKLLTLLIRKRMAGSLFRTFVEDTNGHLVPAYRQRAGSTTYVQDGLPGEAIAVRVSRKRSTAEGVSFELDDRIAEFDSFLARRAQRISVR